MVTPSPTNSKLDFKGHRMAKFEPLHFDPDEGQQKPALHSYLREGLVLHVMIY